MPDPYPPAYDRDAYEPMFCRVVAGSDTLVQVGVKRRPEHEIARRRARRERRDKREA